MASSFVTPNLQLQFYQEDSSGHLTKKNYFPHACMKTISNPILPSPSRVDGRMHAEVIKVPRQLGTSIKRDEKKTIFLSYSVIMR